MAEVKVPARVLEGLEAVRDSGKTNMLDRGTVQVMASRLGHHATVLWLENKENREAYAEGVFAGFVAEE